MKVISKINGLRSVNRKVYGFSCFWGEDSLEILPQRDEARDMPVRCTS